MNENRQKDVLAFILQNPDSFFHYKAYIKPGDGFFSDWWDRLYALIYHCHSNNGRFPTQSEVSQWSQQMLSNEALLVRQHLTEETDKLFTREQTQLTSELTNKFLLEKHLREVNASVKDALEGRKNLEELQALTREVQTKLDGIQLVTSARDSVGLLPFSAENLQNRLALYENLYAGQPIPLGFSELDRNLRGGGVRPGNLIIVMAHTGGGKTATMLNIAANLIRAGYRVVYYTNDDLKGDLVERIDSILTGVPLSEAKEMNLFSLQVRQAAEDITGELIIREYAPYTVNVYTLMSHLHLVKAVRGKVDVVIVDQGDLINSVQNYSERRFQLEHTFADFLNMAKQEEVATIATTQGNRESLKAQTVGMYHTAEGYSKMFAATLVLTLSRSDQEIVNNEGRMTIVKSRLGRQNIVIPLHMDLSRMLVQSRGEAVQMVRRRSTETVGSLGYMPITRTTSNAIGGTSNGYRPAGRPANSGV